MARPSEITAAQRKRVRALGKEGRSVREIAELAGIGKSTVATILEPRAAAVAPAAEEPTDAAPARPKIDPKARPLEQTRQLVEEAAVSLAGLPASSPRVNQTRQALRQAIKMLADLDTKEDKGETPEEAEARRRREDGETRLGIERTVDQALQLALRRTPEAPHGRCPTCGGPLTVEQRTALGAP